MEKSKSGRRPLCPDRVNLNVKMSRKFREAVIQTAEAQDKDVSRMVRRLLRQEVERVLGPEVLKDVPV